MGWGKHPVHTKIVSFSKGVNHLNYNCSMISANRNSGLSYEYTQDRITHWDRVAKKSDYWRGLGPYYHKRLCEIYCLLVPPNQRVLEIGCGLGNLLASLKPGHGVGIDFSPEMVCRAKRRHPQLNFIHEDAHNFRLDDEPFDYIILSDLVNDVQDVLAVFENLAQYTQPTTRLVLNYYSRLWQLPLNLAQCLNLANPLLAQNWLTKEDIENLLYLTGYQTIRSWEEILFPLNIPGFAQISNKFLVRFWPFKYLALTNFTISRRLTPAEQTPDDPSVSIIIPTRNEAENIPAIFERVPTMGNEMELVFVEGHSKDDTFEAIEREIKLHPHQKLRLIKQRGTGKGDAVQEGLRYAEGEIILILDADLSVPPEDLPMFYNALVSQKGEFANGSRLVYPMEKQAMRFLNLVGNKFFSLLLSWLMGQHIKDSLCGTKAFWRSDYQLIDALRKYLGGLDPFGDFDLLFGAAKLNKKIVDIPVRYRERTYGKTNIKRWKHGLLLMKMTFVAASKLKFK